MFYVRWSTANYVPGHCPKGMGLVHIRQCPSVRSTPGVIPNGHGYAVPGHYRLIMPWYGAALIGQMLATT